jgi:hypothetical protein
MPIRRRLRTCSLSQNRGVCRGFACKLTTDKVNLDNFFKLESVTFSIVRKHQGTPAKLLCRTFTQLEEAPEMAEYYRNGRLLDTPEDNVYRRSSLLEEGPMKGRVVYIAMAQLEDQV